MIKNLIAFFLFLLIQTSLFSQQSLVYTSDLVTFNKALELYNNQQFIAAQSLFSIVKKNSEDESIQGDCAYYIANCAVRLNQQNADTLMEEFVSEYPLSLKRNDAYMNVANYYFENGKYSFARKWYDKLDEGSIPSREQDRFYFNNGYTYFKNKRYEEATKYFNRVSTSKKYGSQAKYYLGFIAYEGDDYQKANELFEDVKDVDRYAEGLSYYQADMNFKLGKFQEAIDIGVERVSSSNPQEKSELSKIIGESYFNLEQYEDAIPYLQGYKGKRGKWNNIDYYQLGYALYKQGEFQKAINEFNKIIDGDNSVAQNAYYHLAESYLKLGQKLQALNAFKNASEMEYSSDIKEDAWLNYAKLSYELGNSYQSAPEVIISFLESYPNNASSKELKDLLLDSYITSKNYQAAITLLERNKSTENNRIYQKVAFYRGIELYNEGNYEEAKSYLDQSIEGQYDPVFTARAIFWRAEIDYQRFDFEEALKGYNRFIKLPAASETQEIKNCFYNLGYTYFKLQMYPEALSNFNVFVASNSIDSARRSDAYLRLGDSYFITSQYLPAIESYDQAIENGTVNEDYATFQAAISYGFLDRTQEKVKDLKEFSQKYPTSVFRDDALYELGNTYVAQENINDALLTYTRLISELPTSSYVSKTLLKKALIYDNTGDSDQALVLFKKVVSDFPNSEEALQAVASAKLIYIDQGKVNEYAQWVQTLDFMEIEDAEIDLAAYQAAEQSYLANKPSQAISRFESYLEQFSTGQYALQAHYYLGQLYFSEKDSAKAIPHFTDVVEQERSEYSEQALLRLSELYLEKNEYQNALPYLKRLEIEADYPQNIIFAQTNSMKAYYELKEYGEAVVYAETVVKNAKVDDAIKNDAQIIIARAAFQTGDENKAKDAYAIVSEKATGKLAAEALYYDAYFKNKEGSWETSNKVIQKLAKEFSAYKYFGAKGLILMAKNFYALDDPYQATYILESVIKNFEEFTDIIEEAKAELTIIKSAESKTNSSVESDNN